MFEKLLSNLPYNPSLVHQLGFYAKRMHREASIRRTGMVFIVLSFFVQFFAVVAPPQPTVAYSTNDMINGGIQTKGEAVTACKQNTKNYGDVLANFGISCDDIHDGTVIDALDPLSHNDNLYSMGWHDYNLPGEMDLTLANVNEDLHTLHARKLSGWGTQPYKAIQLTSHVTHKTYYILFDCGNLVSIGVPNVIEQWKAVPVKTPPTVVYPECDKLTVTGTGVRTYKYVAVLKNIINVTIKDYTFDFGDSQSTKVAASQAIASTTHTYAKDGTYVITVTARTNVANVGAYSVACKAKLPVTTKVTQNPPVTQIPSTPVCVYNSALPPDSPACKPCDKAVSSQNTEACVVQSKDASNKTQGITEANGTTAQAGDIIEYGLHAANTGKAPVLGFVMTEDLSDVLDYADVKDLNGGHLDTTNLTVTWPAQDIEAGAIETHTITVQVKDPIPNTPPDPGDPPHFDHVMTNVYGNAINIKLPGSVVTTVVTTSNTLVNTGPGSSLIAAGAIVVIAGYFFARTRLLAQESELAIKDTVSGSL